jgi:hypothetical protein
LAIALVFFCHAQNFDAGSGERLLKDFSKNWQKRANSVVRTLLFTKFLVVFKH